MLSFAPCSLAADSYEWGSQHSGISAYIGSEDSYNYSRPPEELSHYWGEFRDSCSLAPHLYIFFCTVCYWPRHNFIQELEGPNRLFIASILKPSKGTILLHTPCTDYDLFIKLFHYVVDVDYNLIYFLTFVRCTIF